MKKCVCFSILFLLLAFLTSCKESNPLLGEWVIYEPDYEKKSYFEFFDDGKINVTLIDTEVEGEYKIEDGKLTIDCGSVFKIENNKITDNGDEIILERKDASDIVLYKKGSKKELELKTEYPKITKKNYISELGDEFNLIIQEDKYPVYSCVVEIYCGDEKISSKSIENPNKFELNILINDKGIICYEINNTSSILYRNKKNEFLELNTSLLMDKKGIDEDIKFIGEELISQNIKWFNVFAKYLRECNSELIIEKARAYKNNDFTEQELEQMGEDVLNRDWFIDTATRFLEGGDGY